MRTAFRSLDTGVKVCRQRHRITHYQIALALETPLPKW